MGERTVLQKALFYSFSLEQRAPSDHLSRSVDRLVDLSGFRAQLEPYYSKRSRSSIASLFSSGRLGDRGG